jgi:hypothetical protein
MAKEIKHPVETPIIDKMVEAAERHDTEDKIAQQPTPSYVIYQHPVFVVWRMFTQFLILVPFGLIVFFLPA